MPRVAFTPNLARHVDCPPQIVPGRTVREALDHLFATNSGLRDYVLDDQDALRRHMSVFVDGRQLRDRAGLTDPVEEDGEIYVAQALSGG